MWNLASSTSHQKQSNGDAPFGCIVFLELLPREGPLSPGSNFSIYSSSTWGFRRCSFRWFGHARASHCGTGNTGRLHVLYVSQPTSIKIKTVWFFGWLITGFRSDSKKKGKAKAQLYCRHCGRLIDADAGYCKYCGKKL